MRIAWASLLVLLLASPAAAQTATIDFGAMVGAAPPATTPFATGDKLPIVQGGVVHSVSPQTLNFGNIAPNTILGNPDPTASKPAVPVPLSNITQSVTPQMYGAVGDGVADDTDEIQAAIDAAAASHVEVILPCGTYKISAPLTITANNAAFGGAKGGCSYIKTAGATADALVVSGLFVQIHDLQFGSLVPRTGGSYVKLQGTGGRLYDSVMNAPFIGVTISGSDIYIARNWIFDTVAATGKSIVVTGGGVGNRIGYIYMQGIQASQPAAGVFIDSTGDLSFEGGSQFIYQGTGLNVAPGNGQTITSLSSAGAIYFDQNAVIGVNLCPTGTGQILRSRFPGLWASGPSATGVGVKVCAGVSGLDLIDPHVFLNGDNGIALTGGAQINILGGQFAQNGNAAISVAAGVSRWTVRGAMIGAISGLTQNGSGVFVAAGASDYYHIADNAFVGQTTPISDAGTGTHKVVFNNPGDPNDFNIYRDNTSGYLIIRGQQAGFSAFRIVTPAGTGLDLNNAGAPTLPGVPTVAGAGGLAVCIDSAGQLYKKAACP